MNAYSNLVNRAAALDLGALKSDAKIARQAIKADKRALKAAEIPALTVGDNRETVMGMRSIPCAAGAYSDMAMAMFPVGAWAISLTPFLGEIAICQKTKFIPVEINTDGEIVQGDRAIIAWLFEDGTWLSDGEASTRITVLR